MQKILILDADDVVWDFGRSMVAACQRTPELSHVTYEKLNDWDLTKVTGWSLPQLVDHWHTHEVLEKAEMFPGVMDFVSAMRQEGFYVAMVTARGWHKDAERITRAALDAAQLEVDQLVVIDWRQSKAAVVADLFGQVTMVIDDNPAHIEQFCRREVSHHAFLMDKQWNQGFPHGERIVTLDEALQFWRNLPQSEAGTELSLR